NPFWMLIKKLEVLTEVENIKLRFILPRPEKIGTEAGTTANHLPEFGEAAYNFEEHQVTDFRHVDPRIQHIHRHGNLRHLVRVLEIAQDGVVVFRLVIDQL